MDTKLTQTRCLRSDSASCPSECDVSAPNSAPPVPHSSPHPTLFSPTKALFKFTPAPMPAIAVGPHFAVEGRIIEGQIY